MYGLWFFIVFLNFLRLYGINETLDEVSDDDLMDLMKESFDQRCYGSIELLQGREMEQLAHNVRFGERDITSQKEDYDE